MCKICKKKKKSEFNKRYFVEKTKPNLEFIKDKILTTTFKCKVCFRKKNKDFMSTTKDVCISCLRKRNTESRRLKLKDFDFICRSNNCIGENMTQANFYKKSKTCKDCLKKNRIQKTNAKKQFNYNFHIDVYFFLKKGS